jgi:hypothetical protein
VQSGQRRQRHCGTAFADTYASSTASRNSLHRSHGLGKALRSGIHLVESFLTGLSCSRQNFPQSIAGGLPIWRHDRRSSAQLPWNDGAPPYAAASILVNDCGASLPSTEIITRALIDPHGLEPVHGAASVDVRFGVHRAISSYVPILTRNLGGRTTKSSASMNKSRRALQVRRRIRHCAGSRFAKLRMCRP